MANDKKRITELTEATEVKTDHYIPVDHNSYGTQKMKISTLMDTTLTTSGEAADAKATGDAIAAEEAARKSKDLSLSDEINVERNRITNLATLTEGSTTGDAELIDIRVGADGTTYENAGSAVRGQITDLKNDFNSSSDYTNRILSDIVGETGVYSVTVKKGETKKSVMTFGARKDVPVTIYFKLASSVGVNIYAYVEDKNGNNLTPVSSIVLSDPLTEKTYTFTPENDCDVAIVKVTVASKAPNDAIFKTVKATEAQNKIDDFYNDVFSILDVVTEKTSNLIEYTDRKWHGSKAEVRINGDDIIVSSNQEDTYMSAYIDIDVSPVNGNVIGGCGAISGNGYSVIRYGSVSNGTVSWIGYIESAGTIIDVSNIDTLRVALYVSFSTAPTTAVSETYSMLYLYTGEEKKAFTRNITSVDEIARNNSNKLTIKTKNLIDYDRIIPNKANYTINGNTIRVVGNSGETYSGIYFHVDVTEYDYAIVTWKNLKYTLNGNVRIGYWDGSNHWIGYKNNTSPAIDTSDIDTLVIAVYVSTTTQTGSADWTEITDLMVCGEMFYSGYESPRSSFDEASRENLGISAIPDYYFESNYIDGKINTARTLLMSAMGNGDAFYFITDMHYNSQNQRNSLPLIKYISDRLNINKLFDGGDDNEGINEVLPNDMRRYVKAEVHYVVGNHDCKNSADWNQLAYQYDAYNTNQIGNPLGRYYYVDDPQRKMRYVVLSAFKEDGSLPVTNYDQTQADWLSNVGLDVEPGWGIVILSHVFYIISLTDDSLSMHSGTNLIFNAVDNYNGDGEIICLVQGHTHRDRIASTPGGIPVIITTCDKNKPWSPDDGVHYDLDVTRTSGTIHEQAFDIIVINRSTRTITALRIGGQARDGVDDDSGDLVEQRVIPFKTIT